MRATGTPNRPPLPVPVPPPPPQAVGWPRAEGVTQYAFLLQSALDIATLERAADHAWSWQVPLHTALIRLGWLAERDFVDLLARHLGMATARGRRLSLARGRPVNLGAMAVHVEEARQSWIALRVADIPLAGLLDFLATGSAPRHAVQLATTAEIEAIQAERLEPGLIRQVVGRLDRLDRGFSARRDAGHAPVLMLALLAGLAAACLAGWPEIAVPFALVALSIPLLCNTLLRLAGFVEVMRPMPDNAQALAAVPATQLPLYSILVPLYDEAAVLPVVVKSLTSLDYPASRLDILLVLEKSDAATRAAAALLDLPGNVRIVTVPPGGPRTKPKALDYALDFIRGEYVVVYDAEDRPEPAQLRMALARFAAGSSRLACVQARLNVYNANDSFLTRQFALEYTALFDAMLPSLEWLGIPIPLGGTSNHFKASVLREVGAWDPYNVTEDADLGIRLARLGWQTAMIPSTTWEEAPPALADWLPQRTRWLKGWMQTYRVHMRNPLRLWRDLGASGFIGLNVLMGGILLSVLAYPVVYLLIAASVLLGQFGHEPAEGGDWLWWLGIGNLALGACATIGLGAAAACRRGWPRLACWAGLMPLYWFCISAAGYRALWQLLQRPYLWEKTRHGLAATGRGDSRP